MCTVALQRTLQTLFFIFSHKEIRSVCEVKQMGRDFWKTSLWVGDTLKNLTQVPNLHEQKNAPTQPPAKPGDHKSAGAWIFSIAIKSACLLLGMLAGTTTWTAQAFWLPILACALSSKQIFLDISSNRLLPSLAEQLTWSAVVVVLLSKRCRSMRI